MDRFVPPLLGRRRGWVALFQLLVCATLLVMGTLSPSQSVFALALLALVLAFFSASQDIAFDAYRTDVLDEKRRGAGAAVSVLGYRLAMLTSGALALILADHFGWHLTYWAMAALMLAVGRRHRRRARAEPGRAPAALAERGGGAPVRRVLPA